MFASGVVVMDALRAYIRELRKGRGVTQEELADVMGLSLRGFTSWEAGRTDEIKSGPLFRAIEFLKASMDHIRELSTGSSISIEDAVVMAHEWLATERFVSSIPDDQVDEAIEIIRQLRSNPRAYERWLGFGQGLIEQRRSAD